MTVPLASAISAMPFVTVVVRVVLIALGLWLLTGHELHPDHPPHELAPTERLGSMFGYGVTYAVASLSCTVGPFLAVTTASTRSGSRAGVLGVYAGYAAGFALISSGRWPWPRPSPTRHWRSGCARCCRW